MRISAGIGGIIFDLGRVLVDIDVGHYASEVLKHVAVGDASATIRAIMADELIAKFNKGRINPEDFHKALCEKYGADIDYSEFVRLWCSIFRPMEGIEALVGQLRGRTALGLLSNTDVLHWEYLVREYSVVRSFENPTLSFVVGEMKPSPEIYVAAARDIAVAVEDCLYVDDLAENVAGARRVGMQAVLFEGVEKLRDELVGRGLLES